MRWGMDFGLISYFCRTCIHSSCSVNESSFSLIASSSSAGSLNILQHFSLRSIICYNPRSGAVVTSAALCRSLLLGTVRPFLFSNSTVKGKSTFCVFVQKDTPRSNKRKICVYSLALCPSLDSLTAWQAGPTSLSTLRAAQSIVALQGDASVHSAAFSHYIVFS